MNDIKVSVVCITYNQEKYISNALESILKQKTNFNYEVIIGDDHSTDKTQQIIKKYKNKYPDIISVVFRKKNIGAVKNLKDLFCRVKGKYIAICEGDDFFTCNNKLQVQSDFLDKNPDYSMCFHPVNVFYEDKSKKDKIYPDPESKLTFTIKELLRWNYIQTNSVMYRNQKNYSSVPTNIIPGDWYFHLLHAKTGKIGYINKVMSAYRKHKDGIWWDALTNMDRLMAKNGIPQFSLFVEMIKLFPNNKEYLNIIMSNIDYMLKKFIAVDSRYNTHLLTSIFKKYPEEMASYYRHFNQNIILSELNTPNISNVEEKYKEIIDSKFYKIFWPIYEKTKKGVFKKYNKKNFK